MSRLWLTLKLSLFDETVITSYYYLCEKKQGIKKKWHGL